MVGEAELVQRLLARGWVRPEQLEPLGRLRAQGDPRPLADLLLAARLITPAQLQLALAPAPPPTWASSPSPGGSSRPGRAPAELAPGETLSLREGLAVRVEKELGRGGMGVVFLVRDPVLGRRAALKLIRAPSEPRRRRFERETAVTARLDHPGIPPVFEAGRSRDGQDYLLMHYVAGESLAARLEREQAQPRRDWRPLLEALVKVAEAVHYAHSRKVVHRDLKPDNIMLGAFGEVYVMDWGLARNLEETLTDDARARSQQLDEEPPPGSALLPGAARLTRDGILVGTPGFMAPEQARQEDVGPPSDVFALGCVLSCVLVGQPPFTAQSALELISELERGALVLPRARDRSIPPELDAIVSRALRPRPADRYPSAQALGRDLKQFLAGRPVSVFREGPLRQTARLVRAHPTLFASLGLVFALSLLGVRAAGRAREEAVAGERRQAVEEAAAAASTAMAGLAAVASTAPAAGAEGAPARARRVAAALEAHTAAMRWHALAPGDPAARRTRFDAATALGSEALADEQWSLAERAYEAATGLGVDDAAAEVRVQAVQQKRRERVARALATAGKLLTEAAQGALEQRPDGVADAVFLLVRAGEPEVAHLLATRLREVAQACQAVRAEVFLTTVEPTAAEAAAGGGRLDRVPEGLEYLERGERPPDDVARQVDTACSRLETRRRQAGGSAQSWLDVVGAEQSARLEPELREARLCCEALARLDVHGAPEAALIAYLLTDHDARRAAVAALALHRLAGSAENPALAKALERFDRHPVFREQVLALVGPLTAGEISETNALALLRAGEHAEAARQFAALLAQEPQRGELWCNLGLAQAGLGEQEEAERSLTRAVELRPDLSEPVAMRGSIRARLGRLEEARQDQERAVELEPGNALLWFNLGNLRLRLQDRPGALQALDRAVELDPTLPAARINRGIVRKEIGDLEGAVEDLRRAIELAPRDPAALITLGGTLFQLERYAEALQTCDRAVALAPDRVTAWLNRGLARKYLQDLAGARADFQRATELAPEHAEAWAHLAHCRLRLGEREQARKDAELAVRLAPDALLVWSVLAGVALEQGDLARAKAAIDAGRALAPSEPALLEAAGELAMRTGHYAQARELLEEATRRAPQRSEAWLKRADAAAISGYRSDARTLLEEARRHTDDPLVAMAQVRLELGFGDEKRALAALEEVLARAPRGSRDWISALARRGRVRRAMGDAGGEDDLRQAVQLDPYCAEAWNQRFQAHLTAGAGEEARRDLEQVERLRGGEIDLGVGILCLRLEPTRAPALLRQATSGSLGVMAGLFLEALGEDPGPVAAILASDPGPMGECSRWWAGRGPAPGPESSMAWLATGLRARRLGDPPAAREAFARVGTELERGLAWLARQELADLSGK